MPVNFRDVEIKRDRRFDKKIDRTKTIKAVIVDALGNDSGSGSIWADQNARRVWVRELGTAGSSQVPCYNITPVIGLGVILGYEIGSNTREVLRTDKEFFGPTNATGTSYESPTFGDFRPGGRLQLWLASKLIEPLATYSPSGAGLSVNVVGGDYPYTGTRKTFTGQTGIALTQNPNSGEHYYAGLYLDSANALQVVYGASVVVATLPPEPTWPAGAFRLSVVRVNDTQTSITLALDTNPLNDIFDRRMPWSDEQAGPDAILESIIDDKGDLIAGTADDAPAILPVSGNDGWVLTEDSGEATGLKWAVASGGAAASETVSGIAELATQAETDAGTDDLRIVTPLKLSSYPPILLKVKNTTGSTMTTGSMVYTVYTAASGIEAKSPASASVLYATTAAVVVVGGANNADIKVATRGRFSIFYSSTAPSAGDYLILGAANTVTRQTYMSPEVVAIAQATGAAGVVDALLLIGRKSITLSDLHYLYGVSAASDSDFVATIATLPGGATLTYDNPTSGSENTIAPWTALDSAFNAKLVLHNTTRGTSALISAVVVGTNTITPTANVPAGWVVTDTITTRSQVNSGLWTGGAYYFDFDISGMTTKPPLAVSMRVHSGFQDTGINGQMTVQPYGAFVSGKNVQNYMQVASVRNLVPLEFEITQDRFQVAFNASGSATIAELFFVHVGWIVAVP